MGKYGIYTIPPAGSEKFVEHTGDKKYIPLIGMRRLQPYFKRKTSATNYAIDVRNRYLRKLSLEINKEKQNG